MIFLCENIEQYKFKDITKKYDLNNSIITLVFKNQNMIRILSRININNNLILKNQTYFEPLQQKYSKL